MKNLKDAIRNNMVSEHMSQSKVWDILDEMKELLGADSLLDQLCQAMSTDDLEDNLRYIDRMNDLDLFK